MLYGQVFTICTHVHRLWGKEISSTYLLNPLTPNGHYGGRIAPLTSKRCILYIYSTKIVTEYFKHGIYSPFYSLQNAVCFIILTYVVPVLFTFYIQDVIKLKKENPAPKGYLLTHSTSQIPSWEVKWFAASQKIPLISWNLHVHYRTHKCPPPVPILSPLDPVHTLHIPLPEDPS